MRSIVRKLVWFFVSLVVLIGAALAVRTMLAPRPTPSPVIELNSNDKARLSALVSESRIDEVELQRRIATADVVLVGETHFYRETMEFLTRLVEGTDGRTVSLLLEMPAATQGSIDSYLESRDQSILDAVFADRSVLPYRYILEWAAAHRDEVQVITAMDENRGQIVLNRAFLRDTRNETMARHVLRERELHPENLIVAYGGQLHFTMAGRYLFDVENRVPMGARLVKYGIPRDRIVTIMVSGDGAAPICDLGGGGVLEMRGPLRKEPYSLFLQGKIFGVETGGELFDYFVDLDVLTSASP